MKYTKHVSILKCWVCGGHRVHVRFHDYLSIFFVWCTKENRFSKMSHKIMRYSVLLCVCNLFWKGKYLKYWMKIDWRTAALCRTRWLCIKSKRRIGCSGIWNLPVIPALSGNPFHYFPKKKISLQTLAFIQNKDDKFPHFMRHRNKFVFIQTSFQLGLKGYWATLTNI